MLNVFLFFGCAVPSQNDTKIRRKLAYEMYSCVQLLGDFAPKPPDQRLCPWTSPQTPIIGSRSRARHTPPMLKPNSAYGLNNYGLLNNGLLNNLAYIKIFSFSGYYRIRDFTIMRYINSHLH